MASSESLNWSLLASDDCRKRMCVCVSKDVIASIMLASLVEAVWCENQHRRSRRPCSGVERDGFFSGRRTTVRILPLRCWQWQACCLVEACFGHVLDERMKERRGCRSEASEGIVWMKEKVEEVGDAFSYTHPQ